MKLNSNLTSLLIFLILVLDLLAFTSILPLFPTLIDFYGSSQRRDWLYDGVEKFCQFFQNAIGTPSSRQFHSVFFGGVLGSLYCVLQYLSSPLLGALSDVYGRKPVLLLSITGTLLSYAIWAYATTFTRFVISRIVGGLSKASVSICTAIMADIYTQNKVGKGMAIIGGAFSIGFLVGPIVGVYFSQITTDPQSDLTIATPAMFTILLTVLELIFVALTLPETLNRQQRKTLASDVFANSSLYIKPSALFNFSAIADRSGAKEMENLRAYGRAYFTYLFLYSGLEFTLSFLTHIRFNYNSMQQGKMYLFIGVLMIIVQGGIFRRIVAHKHHTAAFYGIISTIPAYITIGCSKRIEVFYGGLALYAIASGLVVPSMTSRVSNLAASDVKGATIGVFRCLGSLARALGPLFAATVFWLLGSTVCYVIGGILLILPALMLRKISPSAATIVKDD